MIEGGNEVIKSLVKMFNEIINTKQIPKQWKMMTIKSIYKGAGSIFEMTNRRGLFMTNIISKIFERVIKNRNEPALDQSLIQYQCGGIKHRSTIDHVMTLMAILDKNRYLKKPTYIIFADAEKCFDKLWLQDGIKELRGAGTDMVDCHIINKMNSEALAVIDTPIGRTDEIELKDIVRQGTIYGPKICGITTDKVNNIGEKTVTVYNTNVDVESLIYVDDIMGAGSKNMVEGVVRNLRQMETLKKFTFNTKKTKYMIIKTNKKQKAE